MDHRKMDAESGKIPWFLFLFYPLVMTNIAMGNGPFIYRWLIYKKWWFSMAMLNNQRVPQFMRRIAGVSRYHCLYDSGHMLWASHESWDFSQPHHQPSRTCGEIWGSAWPETQRYHWRGKPNKKSWENMGLFNLYVFMNSMIFVVDDFQK